MGPRYPDDSLPSGCRFEIFTVSQVLLNLQDGLFVPRLADERTDRPKRLAALAPVAEAAKADDEEVVAVGALGRPASPKRTEVEVVTDV